MSAPALATRPAPRSRPPYDELRRPGRLSLVAPHADQLPLAAAPRDRVVDLSRSELEAYFGPQPTSSRELPNPSVWSRRFLQAAAETLVGLRPVAQLRAAASALVFEQLRRAARGTDRGATSRPASPPVIKAARVCEPTDGVAEVAAVLRRGANYHAVAARIEGIDGAWRCVSLTVL